MSAPVRILVVDDQAGWREICEETFASKGYAVDTAPDLKTAVDLLNRLFFHVAIVDISLQDGDSTNKDGLQVLHKIWSLDEGTVAIVLSGRATPDMMANFLDYGIFDFVSKHDLNPGDLSKQYKSAGFIKATLTKGAGSESEFLRDMKQSVKKAALEAQSIAFRRRRDESPFRFFSGTSAREIQASLKGAGMIELRRFVGQLCWPLYPWLSSHRNTTIIVNNREEALAIEGLGWSRALGKAVIVRFGLHEGLKQSLRLTPIEALDSRLQIDAALPIVASEHFLGQAYIVSGVPFESEFIPPPSKKMRKASVGFH